MAQERNKPRVGAKRIKGRVNPKERDPKRSGLHGFLQPQQCLVRVAGMHVHRRHIKRVHCSCADSIEREGNQRTPAAFKPTATCARLSGRHQASGVSITPTDYLRLPSATERMTALEAYLVAKVASVLPLSLRERNFVGLKSLPLRQTFSELANQHMLRVDIERSLGPDKRFVVPPLMPI